MPQSRSFVASVLSTQKQRQRFYYFRYFTALFCAFGAFQAVDGPVGIGLGVVSLIIGYFTIAPVVAFLVCFIEKICS